MQLAVSAQALYRVDQQIEQLLEWTKKELTTSVRHTELEDRYFVFRKNDRAQKAMVKTAGEALLAAVLSGAVAAEDGGCASASSSRINEAYEEYLVKMAEARNQGVAKETATKRSMIILDEKRLEVRTIATYVLTASMMVSS